MFKTIKNALKTPDIRKRLLYTLILLVIFRLGSYITAPGVDVFTLSTYMQSASNGMAGLIDMISGGAFTRFSVFARRCFSYALAEAVWQITYFTCHG